MFFFFLNIWSCRNLFRFRFNGGIMSLLSVNWKNETLQYIKMFILYLMVDLGLWYIDD